MSNDTRVMCPNCLANNIECSRCGNTRLVLWSTLSSEEDIWIRKKIADLMLCKKCDQLFCRCEG